MTVERWIEAPDGWRLSVLDIEPTEPPRAIAVLGHAMMVDRRTMYRSDRPSLATTLADRGIRTLVADLRGHGRSGPTAQEGGAWSYEQLVDDVALYIDLARSLEPDLPLVLIGNSLFGHVALAHLGKRDDAPVDAIVGFAVNIWNARWNADPLRGWAKQLLVASSRAVVRWLGYLPSRRLGFGTQDESEAYWQSMLRWVPGDFWGIGDDDYASALERVTCPFLHVVSDGDRLLCHPDDAALFSETLPCRRGLRIGPSCDVVALRGMRPPPGHVEMVAHPRCQMLWRWVARWIVLTVPYRGGS